MSKRIVTVALLIDTQLHDENDNIDCVAIFDANCAITVQSDSANPGVMGYEILRTETFGDWMISQARQAIADSQMSLF